MHFYWSPTRFQQVKAEHQNADVEDHRKGKTAGPILGCDLSIHEHGWEVFSSISLANCVQP